MELGLNETGSHVQIHLLGAGSMELGLNAIGSHTLTRGQEYGIGAKFNWKSYTD